MSVEYLYFTVEQIIITVALFGICGAMSIFIAMFISEKQVGAIACINQERNGAIVEVKRKKIGVGQETFNVGERQFLIDMEYVARYEKWNRFGGPHAVLDYNLADAKPEEVDYKIRPMKPATYMRTTKPTSASTNLLIRRKGLGIMITATKQVAMDPKIVGLACLAVGVAIAYLAFSYFHPGLVTAPPPGYEYVVKQLPTNVTSVATT